MFDFCGASSGTLFWDGWMDYVKDNSCRSFSADTETVQTDVSNSNERLSPFLPYDDGYEFPNLFDEIDAMMEASTLVYPLVELRLKSKQGLVKGDLMELPMSYGRLVQIIKDNHEELEDTRFADCFFMKTLLEAAEQRAESQKLSNETEIVAVDDAHQEEELVYVIQVNHKRKAIIVSFRGSVTKTDWEANYKLYMTEAPNPVQFHLSQAATIRCHKGFYDYLFTPSERGPSGPDGEDLSEYHEILFHYLVPLFREYPDYKLHVTGHSLGGALASLFAVFVASEPDSDIPKPVSLFSFASPYVGDQSFRSAHQLLESLGKLRHARIVNHRDIISTFPKISFRWNFFDSEAHVGAQFNHAGMCLRFYEGSDPVDISYPRVTTGYIQASLEEWGRAWEQTLWTNFSWNPVHYWKWPFHRMCEYSSRIEANRPVLEILHLNELYTRKDLVGNLVAEF